MRVRRQTPSGDYTFGFGQSNFLINSPDAVAQLVMTNLRLVQGEWFLDTSAGTPYPTEVLGKTTSKQRDLAIRQAITSTDGVLSIVSFSSEVVNRKYIVNATINTIYGSTTIKVAF